MLASFSKYFLIGLSAIVLFAGESQAASCDPGGGVDPNTWSLIEQWVCEPNNPGVKAHQWACFGDDGIPQVIKYTDGVSDTDKCPLPSQPDAVAPAQPPAGGLVCVSDADTGRRQPDGNGCTRNIHTRADCSEYLGGPYNCPAASAPAVAGTCYVCDRGTWRQAGGVAMSAAQCSRIDNALFNQPNKPSWCQLPQPPTPPAPPTPPGPECRSISCPQAPTGCAFSNQMTNTCNPQVSLTCGTLVCQPAVSPAVINPAPITITNNPVNTNTNTNTVTVNNPAPEGGQVREMVREVRVVQAAAGAGGNVGVGATVISGQVLGVKELPKTGLPALAWSALALIPTGFGLRRFSRVKGALENHPSYIFDMRQFKSGS